MQWVIEIAGERIEGILRTYGDRHSGTLIALVGSSGWVEVAVVNGDAAPPAHGGSGNDGLVSQTRETVKPTLRWQRTPAGAIVARPVVPLP